MPVPQFLSDLLQRVRIWQCQRRLHAGCGGGKPAHEGGTLPHQWQDRKVGALDCDSADTLPSFFRGCGAGHHRSIGEWIGWNKLARQHGIGLRTLSSIIVAKLVAGPLPGTLLKATLDTAAGENPLPSIICRAVSDVALCNDATLSRVESGGQYATTDMLGSLGTIIVGKSCPLRLDWRVWAPL